MQKLKTSFLSPETLRKLSKWVYLQINTYCKCSRLLTCLEVKASKKV